MVVFSNVVPEIWGTAIPKTEMKFACVLLCLVLPVQSISSCTGANQAREASSYCLPEFQILLYAY